MTNEQLQAQVAMLQSQLAQSQRELESFVYAVSHDLRAPLRSLSGFSQALLDLTNSDHTALDSKLLHYLSRIQQASGKLTEMIDGLLKVARIARAEMHPRVLDLSQLCQESFTAIRANYPNRAIDITIAPQLTVKADPRLLRTALDALFDNACKFTVDRTPAHITVTANDEASSGFCISDNGVGFDMAYVDKLFQPFQRLHADPKFSSPSLGLGVGQGIGLGLVSVQRIIARHGGTVRAQATSEGTRVVCYLPS